MCNQGNWEMASVITELKHRIVFKIGVVYAMMICFLASTGTFTQSLTEQANIAITKTEFFI